MQTSHFVRAIRFCKRICSAKAERKIGTKNARGVLEMFHAMTGGAVLGEHLDMLEKEKLTEEINKLKRENKKLNEKGTVLQ